jgi:hypothetical protein
MKVPRTWLYFMALVVECLPSKHKALSSNPSTTKKKKITPYDGAHLKKFNFIPKGFHFVSFSFAETESHYAVQAGLRLPKCWYYSHVPPYPT